MTLDSKAINIVYDFILFTAQPKDDYDPKKEAKTLGEFLEYLNKNLPNTVWEELVKDERYKRFSQLEGKTISSAS